MNENQAAAMLAALKIDLGITTTAYDSRLTQYLEAAVKSIEGEGASLSLDDALDSQLAVMYSAWMWRRRDTMEGMPRMLRYALNNRVLGEKMGAD